jgi:hypothetical protein
MILTASTLPASKRSPLACPERSLRKALFTGKQKLSLYLVLLVLSSSPLAFGQSAPKTEFIPYQSAKPIVEAMGDSLPQELKAAGNLDATKWSAWVQSRDQEIRDRLDRGEEDTLTNLLRFGVTYTKEYRIDDDYLVRYGNSSLVNAFAQSRADDLVRALAASNPPAGLAEMKSFLLNKGFSFNTPQQRAVVKKYLLDNLARLRDEFLKYRAQPKDEKRFQLFQDRGISLDTNLWPDYQLDAAFREMVSQGLLKPGSIRRVAIIGPGLDFVNKESGNDFYPPQTIQPFAVLDSLFQLGLADPATVELFTFDISPSVNAHVERIRKNALQGTPYIVQLPWNTQRPMSDEYRHAFVAYWEKLGNQIGAPVPAISVPAGATGTSTRAVKIRAQVVQRIASPVDMNIVYQRLTLPPEQAFDLLIGTNIFLYYGNFEQELARANAASMLRPGGFLLSNGKLPDTITSSVNPLITDTIFCYQRVK